MSRHLRIAELSKKYYRRLKNNIVEKAENNLTEIEKGRLLNTVHTTLINMMNDEGNLGYCDIDRAVKEVLEKLKGEFIVTREKITSERLDDIIEYIVRTFLGKGERLKFTEDDFQIIANLVIMHYLEEVDPLEIALGVKEILKEKAYFNSPLLSLAKDEDIMMLVHTAMKSDAYKGEKESKKLREDAGRGAERNHKEADLDDDDNPQSMVLENIKEELMDEETTNTPMANIAISSTSDSASHPQNELSGQDTNGLQNELGGTSGLQNELGGTSGLQNELGGTSGLQNSVKGGQSTSERKEGMKTGKCSRYNLEGDQTSDMNDCLKQQHDVFLAARDYLRIIRRSLGLVRAKKSNEMKHSLYNRIDNTFEHNYEKKFDGLMKEYTNFKYGEEMLGALKRFAYSKEDNYPKEDAPYFSLKMQTERKKVGNHPYQR